MNGVQLAWHNASQDHRHALQQFVCTDPPKRQYDRYRGPNHPYPWEMEVQSHVRGLKVPCKKDEQLLIGLDGSGVAVATHFGMDDTGQHFQIWAMATALRARRRGLASAAMERVLYVCRQTCRAQGRDGAGLFCFVDPRNEACQGLLKRYEFEYLEMYDGYMGMVREV